MGIAVIALICIIIIGFIGLGLGDYLAGICMLLAIIVLSILVVEPRAIDVYRGETTLEYKVIDGERVDSTVVFKSIK